MIIGIDLSLNGSAVAAVPRKWRPGAWRVVESKRFAYDIKDAKSPRDRAKRLATVAVDVAAWVAARAGTEDFVYLEDYAYGMAGNGGLLLAEMGGALKAETFQRHGLVVVPVNMNTARKYLLGKLPTGKGTRAPATHQALLDFGCPLKTADERDALVIANYALTEHGRPGLSLAV